MLVTGILGPAAAPIGVVAVGNLDAAGRLRNIGVSLPLSREQSRELAGLLTITGTEATPVLFGLPGQPAALHLATSPDITVEVVTDGQAEHGLLRHAVKIVRIRYDLLGTQNS